MIIGMDFGTTNSGLAVFDGQVRLLPIDPANRADPHVVRTMLYITRGQHYFIGREAIDEYYEHNQGRPTKLRREHVGEIQLTYADLGTFYRDVYVWVDELEPGRLFRSLKSYLQDESYVGTSVWGEFYTLEGLVSKFLLLAKERAERLLGENIQEIVLGRPVKFGDEAAGDRLAEERLARAAILAGYEQVYFELEPVAAALAYQQSIYASQRILVFDFGGGTLDITVMEITPSGRHRVLSTGGLRIAGDVFDQKIIRARLVQRLGKDVVYGPKALNMPTYIYEQLCDWQTLMLLNRPQVLEFIREAKGSADHPEKLEALESLIRNNYSLLLFDQVERAKIELSSKKDAVIQLLGQGLSIEEPLTRAEFERIIYPDARQISVCVDEALATAGMRPEQINAVVQTGGSSLIPMFQRMLRAKFGPEKIRPIDEFSSVTAGLAVASRLLSQGQVDLPGYSRESLPIPEPPPPTEEEDEPAMGSSSRGW